jgi:hypothetical protein
MERPLGSGTGIALEATLPASPTRGLPHLIHRQESALFSSPCAPTSARCHHHDPHRIPFSG